MDPTAGANLNPCPDMPKARTIRSSAGDGPTTGTPSAVKPSVQLDTRIAAGSSPGIRRATARSMARTNSGSMSRGRSSGLRSEEHTSELQSRGHLVCRLLLEKKKQMKKHIKLREKV